MLGNFNNNKAQAFPSYTFPCDLQRPRSMQYEPCIATFKDGKMLNCSSKQQYIPAIKLRILYS